MPNKKAKRKPKNGQVPGKKIRRHRHAGQGVGDGTSRWAVKLSTNKPDKK